MQLRDSFPPIVARDLEEFEAVHGIQFPEPYRAFLLNTNGGTPGHIPFQFANTRDPRGGSYTNWFFGLQDVRRGDSLQWNWEILKAVEKRLPDNIVAIGDDPLGNLICVSVSGQDSGAVYFWDHEREARVMGRLEPDYDNLHLIARTFDEFIDCLARNQRP